MSRLASTFAGDGLQVQQCPAAGSTRGYGNSASTLEAYSCGLMAPLVSTDMGIIGLSPGCLLMGSTTLLLPALCSQVHGNAAEAQMTLLVAYS